MFKLSKFLICSLLFVSIVFSNPILAYDAAYVLGQSNFDTDTAVVSATGSSSPYAITYDSEGERLFVLESGSSRVVVYDFSDGVVNGEAAISVLGQANFDDSGTAINQSGLTNPTGGLFYDADGERLFVGDLNRVLVFDLSDGITDGENAAHVLGQLDFDDTLQDEEYGTGAFPSGLMIFDQKLFVASGSNDYFRVTIFDLSDGITDGENAINVIGKPDFTDITNNTPSQTNLQSPIDLFIDEDNEILYVNDNSRVLTFDLSDGITDGEPATSLLGDPDYTTVTSVVSQSDWQFGFGIDIDTERGILFLPDFIASRVLLFDISDGLTVGENAISVIGQDDFTSDVAGLSASKLNFPYDVNYDETTRRLFVADGTNNRVLVYEFVDLNESGALAAGEEGEAYTESLSTDNDQGTVEFAVVSGTLPNGVSLGINGTFSGSPTLADDYDFTVRATDVVIDNVQEFFDEEDFSITIAAAPPSNGSSGGGSSSGTHFICTDPKALNYSDPDTEDGREKNSICRYDDNKLSCAVDPYLTKAIKLGAANNPADVMLLEKFLNTYENAGLSVNGIYEKADFYNVVTWQEKYPDEILRPWGLQKGSGYVYVTSLQKIKEIHEAKCKDTYLQNTATSSCFVYTENLYRGMRKVEIKAAQKALKASVAPGLVADGAFGPGTEKAVKAFQALHGVRQSGGIGPLTGTELEKVVCQI